MSLWEDLWDQFIIIVDETLGFIMDAVGFILNGIVWVMVFTGSFIFYMLADIFGSSLPKRSRVIPQRFGGEAIYYHGTTTEDAWEIFRTGLWLVGESMPRGVYITPKADVARHYSEDDGLIVIVHVSDRCPITHDGGEVYIFRVPDIKPDEFYYQIEGFNVVGLMTPGGRRIR